MTSDKTEPVWIFEFCLESESGEQVPASLPEELMDVIIDWVEKRELQVGGGYRASRPQELEPGPIFDVDSEPTAPALKPEFTGRKSPAER